MSDTEVKELKIEIEQIKREVKELKEATKDMNIIIYKLEQMEKTQDYIINELKKITEKPKQTFDMLYMVGLSTLVSGGVGLLITYLSKK